MVTQKLNYIASHGFLFYVAHLPHYQSYLNMLYFRNSDKDYEDNNDVKEHGVPDDDMVSSILIHLSSLFNTIYHLYLLRNFFISSY